MFFAGLDEGKILVLGEDRSRWNFVPRVDGAGSVSALLGAKDGTLLAGFRGNGALLMDKNGKLLARTPKDPPTFAMRLARTPEGEIWLGNSSLNRVVREGPLLKLEDHPLMTQPSRNVLAIKEQTGKLWACYSGGLVVRDEHNAWKEFSAKDGLSGNGCWSIAPLPNGDVWYAGFQAPSLSLIRPRADGGITVRRYGPNEGIP